MKGILLIFILLSFMACTDTSNKTAGEKQVSLQTYPEELSKVFDKHGGIPTWRENRTLVFSIDSTVYTTDLVNRKSKIETSDYVLGYDGETVWLEEDSVGIFTGDKMFTYNLMFYFYAMPFVLGDNGIVYEETPPLVFEKVSYPGIKISYQDSVGTSPEDNYFIYYDKETYQMEWLGYTVTYFDKKISNDVHYARYPEWENVGGLLLPKLMVWYQKQADGNLKKTNSSAKFIKTEMSKIEKEPAFYQSELN